MNRSQREALDELLVHFRRDDGVVMEQRAAMNEPVADDVNCHPKLCELFEHCLNSNNMRLNDRHALILERGSAVRSLPAIQSVLDEGRLGGLRAHSMGLARQSAGQLGLLLGVSFTGTDLAIVNLA